MGHLRGAPCALTSSSSGVRPALDGGSGEAEHPGLAGTSEEKEPRDVHPALAGCSGEAAAKERVCASGRRL